MTRDEAVVEILRVSDRLDAWADTAQIQLMQTGDSVKEQAYKNERDNYRHLARRLSKVADELPEAL